MAAAGLFDWHCYPVSASEKWYFLDRLVEIMDNRASPSIYYLAEICLRKAYCNCVAKNEFLFVFSERYAWRGMFLSLFVWCLVVPCFGIFAINYTILGFV